MQAITDVVEQEVSDPIDAKQEQEARDQHARENAAHAGVARDVRHRVCLAGGLASQGGHGAGKAYTIRGVPHRRLAAEPRTLAHQCEAQERADHQYEANRQKHTGRMSLLDEDPRDAEAKHGAQQLQKTFQSRRAATQVRRDEVRQESLEPGLRDTRRHGDADVGDREQHQVGGERETGQKC